MSIWFSEVRGFAQKSDPDSFPEPISDSTSIVNVPDLIREAFTLGSDALLVLKTRSRTIRLLLRKKPARKFSTRLAPLGVCNFSMRNFARVRGFSQDRHVA